MKKIRRTLLKEEKGFTLIEMVLTVALVGIFFTAVAMILPSWLNSYRHLTSVSNALQIANTIADAAEEQLMFAQNVEISNDKIKYQYPSKVYNSPTDFQVIMKSSEISMGEAGSESGPVIPGLVYDKQYFMGNGVELSVKAPQSTPSGRFVCLLTITVFEKNPTKELYKTEKAIRLYGLNEETESE